MADRGTVSGIHGLVQAGSYTNHCYGWSLDIEQDPYEDTNFCDWETWPEEEGWRSFLPGLRGWSGSVDQYADEDISSTTIPGNGPFTAYFYIKYDPDTSTYVGFSGEILVTSLSAETGVEDVAGLGFDFQGTGVVTIGDISGSTTT